MYKKFYIQFVGEDNYYYHPFEFNNIECEITLDTFREEILKNDTLLVASKGYENTKNGWRRIPEEMIFETSKILCFHEDKEYHKNRVKYLEEQKIRKPLLKEASDLYSNLRGIKKLLFDIKYGIFASYDGIEIFNNEYLQKIIDELAK